MQHDQVCQTNRSLISVFNNFVRHFINFEMKNSSFDMRTIFSVDISRENLN
jgi:hypothetical protein